MKPYEFPILISESDEAYSVAVSISESVVVSRCVSRADLHQLHTRLTNLLGTRLAHSDLTGDDDG
jgi:hypothetical protein